MGFGYLSAAIIALIVLLAFRKYTKDRALWRRVKKNLPRTDGRGGPPDCAFYGEPAAPRGNGAARAV